MQHRCSASARSMAYAVLLPLLVALDPSQATGSPRRGPAAPLGAPRGGARALPLSSPVELNPNYDGMTVGDLQAKYDQRSLQRQRNMYSPGAFGGTRRPKPIGQAFSEYVSALLKISPTLYYSSASLLSIFVLWQIPSLSYSMQRHFLLSRANLRARRYHTVLTSALSHASFMHLAVNVYAFLRFGPEVRQSIAAFGLPIWPFCVGAALAGSFAFLAFSAVQGGGARFGSCLGASAVTLALLAFYARTYPSRELGFVIMFIPIRMAAEHALAAIGLVSLFGSIVSGGLRDGIAHGAHLGGLLFGVGFHELLMRGHFRPRRS